VAYYGGHRKVPAVFVLRQEIWNYAISGNGFSGDQLLNSIACHKLAIRGLGTRLIQAIGDSAK
jgi:hypothetical protein